MAGTVKAIDRRSVHQICSGQVVLNLATAIKELVENSLDAGATNIEIKLKEYGSESLEVSDNGSGVEESNFQGLTLKHHTSKLSDFSDLSTVATFGFRGEALSSLCALSDLIIVTCHQSAAVGTKLTYDHDGWILHQAPCPRQQGTTVMLQNLFSTLPVRHKEFLRNLKKEFTKMVQVLQAYCIIASGVKLTCTNQTGNGKKSIVVSTNGTATMKDSITNVFGSKQMQSLLEFNQCEPTAEMCEEFGIKPEKLDKIPFSMTGFISKSDHGQGRSAADRQYYFINRRPCDFPKVSKQINEVYHMYNRHQYPFVVLDISLAKDAVDVNVTPDKRKILVQEEKTLLAVLKASLQTMFEPRSSSYEVNQKPMASVTPSSLSLSSIFGRGSQSGSGPSQRGQSPLGQQQTGQNGKAAFKLNLSSLKRSFAHANHRDQEQSDRKSKQPKLDAFFSGTPCSKSSDVSHGEETSRSVDTSDIPESRASQYLQKDDEIEAASSQSHDHQQPNCRIVFESHRGTFEPESGERSPGPTQESGVLHVTDPSENRTPTEFQPDDSIRDWSNTDKCEESVHGNVASRLDSLECEGKHVSGMEQTAEDSESGFCESVSSRTTGVSGRTGSSGSSRQASNNGSQELSEGATGGGWCEGEDERMDRETRGVVIHRSDEGAPSLSSFERKEVALPMSVAALRKTIEKEESGETSQAKFGRAFRAKIAPSDNASAEEELTREISKDMFAKMEILGQFNLGFIIAKLGQDLFIIDQHATDEKFNFETLQKHTVLQGQKLIQPLQLELTAVNESILMDNLDIFKKNGFDFIIDEDGTPTQRIKLVSQPTSRNWTFGKDDIDELIFMLSDAPGVSCRPTRVRQMFASRACRKSIMIGTALNQAEMKKLVCHMGELEQPWNCPHGRPTMRHLFNLNMMPD
ncbi:mismatch repair endonuclease PMS2-like [Diadema antillarum]|uniref:mismatch repair endonuclease PMS2-like n=1 Tax=Diadema antillarum TaxID=105358 RepID=UPI003A83E87C